MVASMTTLGEHRRGTAGTYPIYDAALYIRATMDVGRLRNVTTRHLHKWIKEGFTEEYFTGVGSRHSFLTFRDLVTLRMVAVMRGHGITQRAIKITEQELQRAFGWEHPFAMAPLWTSAPDVFTKVGDKLVSVSGRWQLAMSFIAEFLTPVRHGLSFDITDEAAAWMPAQEILLDPTVQYGEPCLAGTRVPTQVIWAFAAAGDEIDALAHLYDIPRPRLEAAIDWEAKLQRMAA